MFVEWVDQGVGGKWNSLGNRVLVNLVFYVVLTFSSTGLREHMLWTRLIRYMELWPLTVFHIALLWSWPFQRRSVSGIQQDDLPINPPGLLPLTSSFRLSCHLWGVFGLLLHMCFMISFGPTYLNFWPYFLCTQWLILNEHLHWTNEEEMEEVRKTIFQDLEIDWIWIMSITRTSTSVQQFGALLKRGSW